MKEILLATILLSTAISENILMENYPRSMAWIRDRQFWNRKAKRAPWDDIRPKLSEFSNYNDDRELPQISDTNFISGRKLPSVALIRRPDLVPFGKVDLASSDKSKFGSTKPTVLISIGIQEKTNTDDDPQKECSARKDYRKHNQEWQLQQPFYVEEPKWIEINSNYMDNLPRHANDGDPYILSRGKKIFKLDDKNQDKIVASYGNFLDYASRSKVLTRKSRAKRSADEIDWKNKDSNTEREQIDVLEQKKKDTYIEMLKADLNTHDDPFILSRGKKPLNTKEEHSHKRTTGHEKSIDSPGKNSTVIEHHVNSKGRSHNEDEAENTNNDCEFDKDDVKIADPQLTNKSDPKNLGTRNLCSNYRKKRNACNSPACQSKVDQQQAQWLENIEKVMHSSPYLERRDKHGDLLDLLDAPFIISRGKKASYEFEDDFYSRMELDDEINHANAVNLPMARNLLRTLIVRCNNNNCNSSADKVSKKRTPRDRRDSLDEILTKYDPFYVVRGKRTSVNNRLTVAPSL